MYSWAIASISEVVLPGSTAAPANAKALAAMREASRIFSIVSGVWMNGSPMFSWTVSFHTYSGRSM